ncbi:hypothetical protein SLA2020_116610 [Shorea laevis]
MDEPQEYNFNVEVLSSYATDLTKMAKENKLAPLVGRQKESERMTQILCKMRKNNPCLLGDPEVGKTAIVEALAQNIINETIPEKLMGKKIFAVDVDRFIDGASDKKKFEKILFGMIDEVKGSKGVVILFIDQMHILIAAANILWLALARGEIKCIGATSKEEYRYYREKYWVLKRLFQPFEVPEPSVEETIETIKGLKIKYETHHNVNYTEKAIVAAAKLSHQYISDRFLPDKAIDLIDEAGARVRLKNLPDKCQVTEVDIQKVVAQLTGIPVENFSLEELPKLLQMEESLQKHIVGQDEAVVAISKAIRRSRVGIRDPSRPIASFLFTGPTGVGKTELANALAVEYFGSKEAMVRLDMSEYMERHSVSKIFGSPP